MNEVLDLFRQTGALLNGHFVLRSGLHSREFFQCALLLQDAAIAARVCGWLADKLGAYEATTVISPAVGGIIVRQEVARHLGKRHIFAEKDGEGGLVVRRGFTMNPARNLLVRGCGDPWRTCSGDDSDRARPWWDRFCSRIDRGSQWRQASRFRVSVCLACADECGDIRPGKPAGGPGRHTGREAGQ